MKERGLKEKRFTSNELLLFIFDIHYLYKFFIGESLETNNTTTSSNMNTANNYINTNNSNSSSNSNSMNNSFDDPNSSFDQDNNNNNNNPWYDSEPLNDTATATNINIDNNNNTNNIQNIDNTTITTTNNNNNNTIDTERSELSDEMLINKTKRNFQILTTIKDLLLLDTNESYMKLIKTVLYKYHKYSTSYGIENIGGIMVLMIVNHIRPDIPTNNIKESISAVIENHSKSTSDVINNTNTSNTNSSDYSNNNTNNIQHQQQQQDIIIMDDPIIRVFSPQLISHMNEDLSQSSSTDFRKSKSTFQPITNLSHSLSLSIDHSSSSHISNIISNMTNNKSRQISSSRSAISSSLTFQTPTKAMKIIREKAADSVSVLNLMSGGGKKRNVDEQSLEIFRILGLIDIHYMEDMKETAGGESDYESEIGAGDNDNNR